MYKAFAFDLGNVIVPFNHSTIAPRLLNYSIRKEIYSSSEIHNYLYKTAEVEHLYEEGKISTKEFVERIKYQFELEISDEEFRSIFCDIFFDAHPETIAIIKAIKQKSIPLILVSNTNEMHFEFIKSRYEFINLFDAFLLSYKVGVRKPNKKIYEELIKITRLMPNEIFYIDDIEEYVKSAAELDIATYHFTTPQAFFVHLSRILTQVN
ncbi:MAG: HAD family phosphatase [Deltaproteobacteria bacterium]|nr:HAD family phosphatase [Deltaproteobacteria bacterium]